MKDFLGQEYAEGDTVLWAAGSGRSITMCVGKVVKFNESGSISVQPVRSSRWAQHHGSVHYLDTRTGKKFSEYAWTDEHIKDVPHWIHKETGEREDQYAFSSGAWDAERREYVPPRLPFSARANYTYVPRVWEDYMVRVDVPPKPVTLRVTENIVKWDGELPPEEES